MFGSKNTRLSPRRTLSCVLLCKLTYVCVCVTPLSYGKGNNTRKQTNQPRRSRKDKRVHFPSPWLSAHNELVERESERERECQAPTQPTSLQYFPRVTPDHGTSHNSSITFSHMHTEPMEKLTRVISCFSTKSSPPLFLLSHC